MTHPAERLFHRLQAVIDLPQEDRRTLEGAFMRCETVPAGSVLVREAEPNRIGFLITSGWAMRERHLRDGSRQVINFLVPGDLSEPGAFVTDDADHTVTTLTEATVCRFTHRDWFMTMTATRPLSAALWWLAAHEEAVVKEHLVSIGRRSSRNRLLYLLWELWRRLRMAGLAEDNSYTFPVGREVLADATGLTPRHLGRVLAEVRGSDMLTLERGRVHIHDPARLLAESDCRDVYLQITPIAESLREVLRQPRP